MFRGGGKEKSVFTNGFVQKLYANPSGRVGKMMTVSPYFAHAGIPGPWHREVESVVNCSFRHSEGNTQKTIQTLVCGKKTI